jgi:hypothetical protein
MILTCKTNPEAQRFMDDGYEFEQKAGFSEIFKILAFHTLPPKKDPARH